MGAAEGKSPVNKEEDTLEAVQDSDHEIDMLVERKVDEVTNTDAKEAEVSDISEAEHVAGDASMASIDDDDVAEEDITAAAAAAAAALMEDDDAAVPKKKKKAEDVKKKKDKSEKSSKKEGKVKEKSEKKTKKESNKSKVG